MSGIKYLLDTNALISFLQGNPNLSHLTGFSSCGISIISVLEFLSFTHLEERDKKVFFESIETIEVIEVKLNDLELINTITHLRKNNRIKLPDAIIAGTAIYNNAVLISNDKGFTKIPSLQIAAFN
jgi:predicted nucleic acid-binding protein